MRSIFLHAAVLLMAVALMTPDARAQGAAKPQATGTVIIDVTPAAVVFVGPDRVGEITRQTLVLPAARHVLTFNHPDYKPLRRTIAVVAGQTVTVTLDLAEKAVPLRPPAASSENSASTPGAGRETAKAGSDAASGQPAPQAESALVVRLEPKALLRIDGRLIGEVTDHTEPLLPGRHVVLIEHPDYQPLQRFVTVKEGETASLVLNLAEKGRRKK